MDFAHYFNTASATAMDGFNSVTQDIPNYILILGLIFFCVGVGYLLKTFQDTGVKRRIRNRLSRNMKLGTFDELNLTPPPEPNKLKIFKRVRKRKQENEERRMRSM